MERIKFDKINIAVIDEKIQSKRKRAIMTTAEVLDRVKLEYSSHSKTHLGSFVDKMARCRDQHTKMHNGLYGIYTYAEKLKAGHGNLIEHMLEDYFMCIFDYYSQFKRVPFFNQLLAGPLNQQRFEEWINSLEEDIFPDKYFIADDIDINKLKRKAVKRVQGIISKQLNGVKVTEKTDDIGIIEV